MEPLWACIQQMYARLNQANYFVDRLQTIAKEAAASRQVSDEPDDSAPG